MNTSAVTVNFILARYSRANAHWTRTVFSPNYPDDEPPSHPKVQWAESWRIRTLELEEEILALPEVRRLAASLRSGEEPVHHTPDMMPSELERVARGLLLETGSKK